VEPVCVRLAEHLPDDSWLAPLLCQQGEPCLPVGCVAGCRFTSPLRWRAIVDERDRNSFLDFWKLRSSQSGTELINLFTTQPICARLLCPGDLGDHYQTVYAKEPGSLKCRPQVAPYLETVV